MATCAWSYADCTPYEVLRVPSHASISDIRAAFKKMALCTHPDKQCSHVNEMTAAATSSAAVPLTFHAVKEASEILLDPFQRAAYDAARSHALVREVGAVSDTFRLAEDFYPVPMSENSEEEGGAVRVYQCECRCGGVYEVVIFEDATATTHGEQQQQQQQRTLRCECDSCSLVVEVIVE